MVRLYAAIAVVSLAMSGASFFVGEWKGYSNGVAHERAAQETARLKTQKQLFKLGENMSRKAAELDAMQQEREGYAQILEDEARQAVGADRLGVGSGGLHRLEQRWGSP